MLKTAICSPSFHRLVPDRRATRGHRQFQAFRLPELFTQNRRTPLSRARESRDRILSLLLNLEGTSVSKAVLREEVMNIISIAEAEGLPYDERLLDGKWRVVFTAGGVAAWEALTGNQRVAERKKEGAFQEFNVKTKQVENSADIFGGWATVFGEGFYSTPEAQRSKKTTPITLDFTAERGRIEYGPDRAMVPLPISGKGTFEILYLDPPLRIFRSPEIGSIAVQLLETAP